MKTLVIGAGGREHALAMGLSLDPGVSEVHVAPGNPGIGTVATLHDVDAMDGAAVAALAVGLGIDLVVIGPEAPLVAGVADAVREAGIAVFGPSGAAAQLEGSKAFSKDVMAAAGVPTARSRVCVTREEAAAALDEFGAPYVVKDDALAAGKGVVVSRSRDEALAHAVSCERVVIEEFLDGPEVSIFAVCDGRTARALPPAQDFKRIFDGGLGANTGGMGAYSPLSWAPSGLADDVLASVVQPTLDEMNRRGTPFVGTLYVGLALTDAGPRVIEFNCRFGDPDIQPVLALLTSPLGGLLKAAAEGDLGSVPAPTFADGACVSVVMASAGYPESSSVGDVIVGTETLAKESDVDVIHAGTARTAAGLVTAGGRVLAVRAIGSDVADARAKAYEGIATISFPGAQWRRDIAAEPLGVMEGASLTQGADVNGTADDEQAVTDSGGTMRRLEGPVAAGVAPDLALLEGLRRATDDGPLRAAGSAPFFEAGAVMTWHYGLGVEVLRVVRDDERGLVAWLPAGSERLAAVPRDGKGLRERSLAERAALAASGDYDRLRRTWDGPGILRIAPTGVPWSLWYFWEEDGSFAGHYVNLELVHERPVSSDARVHTRDLTLDLWLEPDGQLWLKDEDELAAFAATGYFAPEQAEAITTLADRVRAELIEPRAWPLSEDWESWRPPLEIDRPLTLPDHLENRT